MSAASPSSRPRQRRTNGGVELPRTDGRTVAARRFRTLVENFTAELGGDLSAADAALCRQAASLVLAAERQQADIVAGEAIDADSIVRINSEARRILALLRSKAVKNKPAGPTLAEYAARKAAEKAAAVAAGDAA